MTSFGSFARLSIGLVVLTCSSYPSVHRSFVELFRVCAALSGVLVMACLFVQIQFGCSFIVCRANKHKRCYDLRDFVKPLDNGFSYRWWDVPQHKLARLKVEKAGGWGRCHLQTYFQI